MSYRGESRRSRSRSRGRESGNGNNRNNFDNRDDRSRHQEGGNQGHYDRGRDGSGQGQGRDRDRDRDFFRQDRDQSRTGTSRYGSGGTSIQEPIDTKSVLIRGLSYHTTEPSLYAILAPFSPQDIRLITQRQEIGEHKGYGFVDFYSSEHAAYFMATFAGSAGDPNAPQLIIDNRAVMLEYSKERPSGHTHGGAGHSREDRRPLVKCDWICEKCSCQNFARRQECYRCSAPKTDTCVTIALGPSPAGHGAAMGLDPYGDAVVSTQTPNSCLVVRGLTLLTSEDQLMELFRQYALVKTALVIRERTTGMSRGLALVEFHSVEHATYALQSAEAAGLAAVSGGQPLRVSYARPTFVAAQMQEWQQAQQQQSVLQQQAAMMAMYTGVPSPALPQASQVQQAWSLAPGISPTLPAASSSYIAAPTTYPPAAPLTPLPVPQSRPPLSSHHNFPPNFETNGGAYMFQAQSGLFLDPVSDFYYCPKSKLYYSSKDGSYYKYIITENPPFVRFLPPVPASNEPISGATTVSIAHSSANDIPAEPSLSDSAAAALARRPVILSIGGAAAKSTKSTAAKPIVLNKKILSNLAKWESANDAGEEEPAGDTAASAGVVDSVAPSAFAKISIGHVGSNVHTPTAVATGDSPPAVPAAPVLSTIVAVPSSLAPGQQQPAPVSIPAVIPAAAGATSGAVCLLCRRQFANAEQLLRHERESKLHAENLAKLQQQQATAPVPAQPVYRDRASERRLAHGETGIPLGGADKAARLRSAATGQGQVDDDDDRNDDTEMSRYGSTPSSSFAIVRGSYTTTLGEAPKALKEDVSNPGNQLLRKMGWSEGQGLGKDLHGIEEPIEAVARAGSKAGVGAEGSGTGANGTGVIPPLVYSDSAAYKESLLRAARTRYDQIQK